MSPHDVRNALTQFPPAAIRALGVEALSVFGSVARGDAHEGSDVDVLVDFSGAADFDRFMALRERLEALLGCPIDLVTRKALRPELRARIEQEAVRIA